MLCKLGLQLFGVFHIAENAQLNLEILGGDGLGMLRCWRYCLPRWSWFLSRLDVDIGR